MPKRTHLLCFHILIQQIGSFLFGNPDLFLQITSTADASSSIPVLRHRLFSHEHRRALFKLIFIIFTLSLLIFLSIISRLFCNVLKKVASFGIFA